MDPIYVYAGSFCPPTYGHLRIAVKAAELFPKLLILCSTNPEKDSRWFSEDECKGMWQSYHLPANVETATYSEFARNLNPKNVVLIRGIRGEKDLEDEKRVLTLNSAFGIDKYFYLVSECAYRGVSSSKARELAEDLDLNALKHLVAPLVVSRLLEKILDVEKIFLAVGKPGSGKSTLLKAICRQDSACSHINTDEFNDLLKPLLLEKFPGEDLIELAINKPAELKAALKPGWLALMKKALETNRGRRIIFVEVPFGLQADKHSYRYLGGRVIYFGCNDEAENYRRIKNRGTPEHQAFVSAFPGLAESRAIAEQNLLNLIEVNTSGDIAEIPNKIAQLLEAIEKGGCR